VGNEEICSLINPVVAVLVTVGVMLTRNSQGNFLASVFSSSAAEISRISSSPNKDRATSVTPKI
jgi:hypothetical protein